MLFRSISELILYPPLQHWESLTPALREDAMLHIYRFAPSCEWATLAWELHARELERAGKPEQARVWHERSVESQKTLSFMFGWDVSRDMDFCLLSIEASLLSMALFIVYQGFRYRVQRRLDRAQRRSAWSFFGGEYWSRGERISWLVFVLAAWGAFLIFEGFGAGVLNRARAPISGASGTWAGEGNQYYLKSLPWSPERELLLGLSAQQGGQFSEAEQIYRGLQFAESWNNLGVLLRQQHKEDEAAQAFRRALELDPQLAEATLNLGKGATDSWTTQYQRYYPGRPMIAVPRTAHNERAFLGGSVLRSAFRVVSRPFEIIQLIHHLEDEEGPSIPSLMGMLVFALFGLLFAILLVTVAPKREVTVPPGKREWIWSALVPGLGPHWGVLSCLVLLAWSYLLIQLVLFLKLGSPYVITLISIPNLARSYGVLSAPLMGGLNPGWFAIYAAPALLFAVNALLVLRNRGK